MELAGTSDTSRYLVSQQVSQYLFDRFDVVNGQSSQYSTDAAGNIENDTAG